MGDAMVEFLAGLLTLMVFPRARRLKWRRRLVSFWYGIPVRRRAKSVGVGLRCHSPVTVSRHTVIGNHASFNGATVRGTGDVTFGNWDHLGEGLKIFTRNHNYEGEAIPYDDTFVRKPVTVGDCVWIGAHVILLPGTNIGEGAIIQAGSVVHGTIPPYAIAGGNPAKVFARRDVEHFKRLKAEGKFR